MFADVNVLLFPAPVSEGADEAGWWDQGCEWGLRVGFVRSLFWIFPLPRFSWIELTPYMCRVLFGSWLALRMPLQCPFSKLSGAESQIFKTESGPEPYIYIDIYMCVYKFKNTHTYTYIYISLMKIMFQSALFTSFCLQFLFTYVCLDSGIVHIQMTVQGLPKARSKGQAEFWSTGARQRENQRCGGFDWWHLMGIFGFFQEFADTGKTQDTEITLYNYT